MGKILHRYFLTEIATAFLGGVAIFTFIVFIERIIELVDLVFARGVPGHLVMGLFAYILPSFLEFTVPMALLLGIVVAFSRLASDGELLALRAAGINIFQMLGPVLVFAAITAVVTLALTVHVRPWGNRNVRETLFEIAKTKATAALRPRFFNTDFEDLVIYVDDISPDSGALEGVMLSDERDSSRRTTVFAERGRIVGNEDAQTVYLHLLDGTSISFQADQDSWDWMNFSSLEINLDVDAEGNRPTLGVVEPQDMPLGQLLAARAARQASGDPAIDESIELHRKFALAAASFVLALVAVPLGMQPTRSVRARGFGVSLGVILLYFVLLSAGVAVARKQILAPPIAMWLPNLVMGLLGSWLFLRAARERLLYPSLLQRLRTPR